MQTIFIAGVSDGIAHALAAHYAAKGARVLGIGRRSFPASLMGMMQKSHAYALPTATFTAALLSAV